MQSIAKYVSQNFKCFLGLGALLPVGSVYSIVTFVALNCEDSVVSAGHSPNLEAVHVPSVQHSELMKVHFESRRILAPE